MGFIKDYINYNLKAILNSAIILAAGTGSRLNKEKPKQFLKIKNKMIIDYSINTFNNNNNIDEIIIVSHKDWLKEINFIDEKIKLISGGKSRSESSFIGLKQCNDKCKNVIIHDAARPFFGSNLIDNGIIYMNQYDAAIPILDTFDSIVRVSNSVQYINREKIKKIQTPQFFKYDKILAAYANNVKDFKDDLSLLLNYDSKINFKLFYGEENNFKITTPYDYQLAQKII